MLASVAQFAGHRDEVCCLHSPEVQSAAPALASGGADGSVRIWDMTAGRAARAVKLPVEGSVTAVCMGSTGEAANWMYAACGTQLFGFDLRAPGILLREPARRFTPSRDEVAHLTLHSESGALAATDDAGEVHVHDSMGAGGVFASLVGVHSSLCSCSCFRPTRDWELYSAGLDSLCVRWDWRRAARIDAWPLARPLDLASPAQLLNPRHAHSLSFVPDGGAMAFALGDGSVEIWEAETGTPIAAVDAHRAACSQALFAPLAQAAMLQAARGEAGGAAHELPSAAALPLVSAGDDRQVRLWAVEGAVGHCVDVHHGMSAKRSKSSAALEPRGSSLENDDLDDVGGDEPGFREMASTELREKPNCVAAVTESSGRTVICVATTGALIDVLAI